MPCRLSMPHRSPTEPGPDCPRAREPFAFALLHPMTETALMERMVPFDTSTTKKDSTNVAVSEMKLQAERRKQ